MKTTHTPRGFALIEFEDRNGTECNIQKSSLAFENAIWIGASKIGLKQLVEGKGWQEVDFENTRTVANNRMHLTQDQVKDLLPILQYFAETGEIPELNTNTNESRS